MAFSKVAKVLFMCFSQTLLYSLKEEGSISSPLESRGTLVTALMKRMRGRDAM